MEVIEYSDIVLYVLDARFPEESRSAELDRILGEKRTPIIYVFSKSDLLPIAERKNARGGLHEGRPCVFVSSRDGKSITKLRATIGEQSKKLKWPRPRIGVIGYPNVGKSSIINALKGSPSAKTSKQAGMTRGKQYLSAGRFLLIDSPGVIPRGPGDPGARLKMSVKSYSDREAVDIAYSLAREKPEFFKDTFGVDPSAGGQQAVEQIAMKKGFLLKGNSPDVNRASRFILRRFQEEGA